jgi:arylsulfatase A-like enzyme
MQREAMRRPNILYIHSHDTGRYVAPYGFAMPTPNIQRLAEGGVLFRQAFCANPTCSASRAAMLTGQWPHNSGMFGLAHRGWSLNDYSQHLIHTLHAAGYRSALSGVQHVASHVDGDPAKTIGYHERLETGPGRGDANAAAGADYIRRYAAERPDQPFFLSVGFGETHRDFPQRPLPHDDWRYNRPPMPLPDTPETRKDMAAYTTLVRRLDQAMGVVFDALHETALDSETLVICTTDHGIAFPFMKCNLTDHGIGVMLIMRGPGEFAGGKCIDGMVSHVDVFPTLCDYLGIDRPAWLEGQSVLPMVRGETDRVREELFAEVTYHASYEPMRAVRTDRYKYIRRYDTRDKPVLPNCDPSISKDLMIEQGWGGQPRYPEMLFDLMFDPNEACNLVGQAHADGALEEMRKRLADWQERTDDPLRHGHIPAPKGAKINDPDGLSAREAPMIVE